MREIKFRGIKKGKNHFVYGNLSIKFDMAFIQTYLEDTRSYEDVEVEPETVGQYTELEYNFHKYFEHDICQMVVPTKDGGKETVKGVVGFTMGSFFLNEIGGKWRKWIFAEIATMAIRSGATVFYLGNIHDNPELLT